MSLDISVSNATTEQAVELNWLRNPFGLERWARANYLYVKKEEPKPDLWGVINQWNYDKAEQVDKPVFLEVVKRYGEVILHLEKGYFWFDITAYLDFIRPHEALLPWKSFGLGENQRIAGAVYQHLTMGIPMEYLSSPVFGLSDEYRHDAHSLARYQAWYQQLIDFAEILQHPDSMFYCSN